MHTYFAFFFELTIIFYAVCYLSVLSHEAAHAGMARVFGIPVYKVAIGKGPALLDWTHLSLKLLPAGGQISLREDTPTGMAPITAQQLAWIACAGPLANLVIIVSAAYSANLTKVASLGWCALTFATLFNILCFFQNAFLVEDTDGFLFWSYFSERYYGGPVSDWAASAVNKVGTVTLHWALGGYMGWLIWSSGILKPFMNA